MGLANNEILKGAVDALTAILNGINNIINALSGGNGLIKSVLSLGAVIGSLALGRTLLDSLLGSVGATLGKGLLSEGVKQGIFKEATATGLTAGKIMGSGVS
jgi:hypothetical protein